MEYKQILERGEKVLWVDRPTRRAWILKGFAGCLFGLIWLAFTLPMFLLVTQRPFVDFIAAAMLGFFVLIGLVMIFSGPLYAILTWRYIRYIVTNKRVIAQTGLIGRDFQIIERKEIVNAYVSRGLVDRLCGTGTIEVLTPAGVGVVFATVAAPYAAMKKIRKPRIRPKRRGR